MDHHFFVRQQIKKMKRRTPNNSFIVIAASVKEKKEAREELKRRHAKYSGIAAAFVIGIIAIRCVIIYSLYYSEGAFIIDGLDRIICIAFMILGYCHSL